MSEIAVERGYQFNLPELSFIGRTYEVPFIAEAFAHLLIELTGVDKLYFAFPVRFFLVGENPYVGRDTRVIKELVRQGNNGFKHIFLDNPSSYLRFPASGITSKKGRTVKDNADAASAILRRAHF